MNTEASFPNGLQVMASTTMSKNFILSSRLGAGFPGIGAGFPGIGAGF